MTDAALTNPAVVVGPAHPRLPLRTKLAFGAGDLGPAIGGAIIGYFQLAFLINVAGLAPGVAGTILLVAKLWDGVNDPVIGWLTDHTTSRFGRRRPWLLFGAVPFGLMFFLLWIVPPLEPAGKFWYYLLITLLYDTALTVVLVPYASLTAQLTPDYDERTNLTSVRMSFSLLGTTLALLLHTQILAAFEQDPIRANLISAALWAVVLAVPFFITFWGTREPPLAAARAGAPPEPGFFEGLRIAFRNRAFVMVTIIYLLSWLALQLVQNNLFIYVKDWVGMATEQFGIVLLVIQLGSFVWLLIWARVSERIGKQRVYYIGMSVFILVEVALFFVQPGQTWLVFALAAMVTVGVSVAYLVPWSMLPDVVELDELQTGQRREGIFYGMFAFLQKLGLALGLGLSGWALQLAGYINAVPGQPDPVQPASALLALRVLVGPAGAIILLLSMVAVAMYPLTRERHAQVRAQLRERQAQQASG